jgi:hypothetical protein
MAFENAITKINAVTQAGQVLDTIRSVHSLTIRLQAALVLYQAGTDATFNAAFNAVFSGDELSELGGMISALMALTITDWEANHADALGL